MVRLAELIGGEIPLQRNKISFLGKRQITNVAWLGQEMRPFRTIWEAGQRNFPPSHRRIPFLLLPSIQVAGALSIVILPLHSLVPTESATCRT